MKTTRLIVEAALIAAMYAVLTIFLAPFSYGPVQVRISEALTILPVFTPAAIPGLFIGCIVANIYSGNIFDIVFGSLATLIAAYATYKVPKQWLAPLPPVIVNGIVVGLVLHYTADAPLWATMGSVALGELVACYVLGYLLMVQLNKHKSRIFKGKL